jgi:hypothetical protein
MVKKIKKKLNAEGGKTGWLVGFDGDGQAAMYVHRHGETEDHALCGPIVMCCEKCKAPYGNFAPDQTNRVKTWLAQPASHLKGWFEGGLQTMYFVLCEPNDQNIFYFVEMGHAQALDLLYGTTPASKFRKDEFKINVPEVKAQLAAQLAAQRAIAAPAAAAVTDEAPAAEAEAPAAVEAPAEG